MALKKVGGKDIQLEISTFLSKKRLLFLFICLEIFYFLFFSSVGFRNSWYLCVEDLAKGELYSNQPRCASAPIVYFIGFLVISLFPIYQHSQFIFGLLGLFLHFTTCLLIFKIIERESRKKISLFSLILLGILFYFFIPMNADDTPFAIAFFMIGFYLLLFSEKKYKYIASGIFFSLSVFSKLTTSFMVLIVIFYFFYRLKIISINKKNPFFNKRKFIHLLLVVLPLILFFLFFNIVFENFILYTFKVKAQLYTIGVSDKSYIFRIYQEIWKPEAVYYLLMLIVSAVILIKSRDIYSLLAFFGLLFIMALGGSGDYLIPPTIFFIFQLILWFNQKRKSNILLILVLCFMLFMFLKPFLREYMFNEVKAILNIPLHTFLENKTALVIVNVPLGPVVSGKVLVQPPEFLGISDNINRYAIDKYVYMPLQKLGIYNKSFEKYLFDTYSEKFEEEIEMYDIIIIGSAVFKSEIYKLLNYTNKLDDYCNVLIPYLSHLCKECTHCIVFFSKDNRDCENLALYLKEYYTKISHKLCSISPHLYSYFLNKILSLFNQIEMNLPECNSKREIFDEVKYFEEVKWWELTVFLAVFIFLIFKLNLIKIKNKKLMTRF